MTGHLSEGQHGFVEGRTIIAYYIRGRGPPCIVAPYPWGLNSEPIRSFFKRLEQKMTLIYHDPPGTGRSGPPMKERDLGMGRVVSDMYALQSRLNLRHAAFMGHSGGAACALSYALRYPAKVSHLILIGAGPILPDILQSKEIREVLSAPNGSRDEHRFRQLQAEVLGPEIKTRHGKLAMGRAMKSSLHFNIDRAAYNFAEAKAWDVRNQISSLPMKTLIMVGRLDRLTPPAWAEEMRESIPDSKLVTFARSGHFPFLDEPVIFSNEVTKFLRISRRKVKKSRKK